LLVCGGAALLTAASSLAQPVMPGGEGLGRHYRINLDGQVLAELGPYSPRTVGYTYSNYLFNASAALGGTSNGAGHRHDLEDISYTPGPWSSFPGPYTVSRLGFSLRRVQAVAAPPTCILQFRWWNAADVNWLGFAGAGSSMFNPAATPVQTVNINLPAVNNDLINGFDLTLPTPFTLPNTATFVEARLLSNAADPGTDLGADAWRLVLSNTSGQLAPSQPGTIGSTTPDFGLDQSAAGPTGMIGGAANAPAPNRHVSNVSFNFGTTGHPVVGLVTLDFAMGGEIPAQAPVCQTLLLGPDNTFVSDTRAYAATGVKWYCVTLTHDATDGNLRYIDFDTETAGGVDAALAVYRGDGTLVATDDSAGSGVNAMLSFGIGRRAAVGDGRQYDGRNWDNTQATPIRGLAAGTYFVAVATSGVGTGAAFSAGWTATGSGTAGNITLRVRANDSATGALDPSIPPVSTRIVGASLQDPIVAPGGQSAPAVLNGPDVMWFDVNLCRTAGPSTEVRFDATGTEATSYNITVFDDSGNLVDQAAGTNTAPAVIVVGGAGLLLPSGHYYAAMTYAPLPDLAPSPTTAGRWHARGENESAGFNFRLGVWVPWNDCGASACCRNDFNADGDVGTDLDIEDFFNCLAGNCCANCPPDADFNCDGDAGTDADIESFFRVLGGGAC
jgi:hypothetical protein